MSLLFNMPSRLVIAFLSRSKRLLMSWLRALSVVILGPKKMNSVTISIVSPSICHEMMGPEAMILVWVCFYHQFWFGGSLVCLGVFLFFAFLVLFFCCCYFFYWFVFWLLGFVFITCWGLYLSVIFFFTFVPVLLLFALGFVCLIFSFFDMPHGLWGHGSQAVGQKLLWWKLQVQASRPPEISREY